MLIRGRIFDENCDFLAEVTSVTFNDTNNTIDFTTHPESIETFCLVNADRSVYEDILDALCKEKYCDITIYMEKTKYVSDVN